MIAINELSQKNALQIANNWKYSGDFAFYDMTADLEDYNEFIHEDMRNNVFEVLDENELIGYFSYTVEDDGVEIGLGLRPDICGKGYGKTFVLLIEKYILSLVKTKTLKMNVASFNKRAINCYQTCGYTIVKEFTQETNGGEYQFIEMVKQV
ncbi:GNAT family N-acetyltransferase [Anaerorhabdus sp.]|uniref:GNAT family N-acetyltransferase n=1 Tax=Anaerorhabdus sp. TaxID=1872524 RepID=UPI002FC94A9B